MPSTRTPIPSPELVSDLSNLGSSASVIQNALIDLLDNRSLPASTLPSLQAARRAAQSLVTHLQASQTLAEVAQ